MMLSVIDVLTDQNIIVKNKALPLLYISNKRWNFKSHQLLIYVDYLIYNKEIKKGPKPFRLPFEDATYRLRVPPRLRSNSEYRFFWFLPLSSLESLGCVLIPSGPMCVSHSRCQRLSSWFPIGHYVPTVLQGPSNVFYCAVCRVVWFSSWPPFWLLQCDFSNPSQIVKCVIVFLHSNIYIDDTHPYPSITINNITLKRGGVIVYIY